MARGGPRGRGRLGAGDCCGRFPVSDDGGLRKMEEDAGETSRDSKNIERAPSPGFADGSGVVGEGQGGKARAQGWLAPRVISTPISPPPQGPHGTSRRLTGCSREAGHFLCD